MWDAGVIFVGDEDFELIDVESCGAVACMSDDESPGVISDASGGWLAVEAVIGNAYGEF